MASSIVDISPTAPGLLGELEDSIRKALKKTESLNEFALCAYLSGGEEDFSPSVYLKLKDTDQKTLLRLIKERILDIDPYKTPHKVQNSPAISPYSGKSLEECIKEAMTKMNVLRETALCKYIPVDEGYLHHFTFLKMKSSNPIQLRNLINEHILVRTPKIVLPKPRKKYKTREFSENLSVPRPFDGDNLNGLIIQAMDKIGLSLQNEEDLCRYLPQGDSFVHPLAYRSLKRNNPRKLAQLIKEYVINPENPQLLKWKKIDQRPSGLTYQSCKRVEFKDFELDEGSKIDQLLKLVSQLPQAFRNGQIFEDIPRKPLQPSKEGLRKRSNTEKCIQIIQNELIMKILRREIDQNLWEAFVEIVSIG